MLRHRTLAVCAAALTLAAPAPALAQSAGDDQYVDPLGGAAPPSGGSGSGSGSGSGGGGTAGAGAGTAGTTAGQNADGSAPSSAGSAAAARDELPRTGFPAGLAAGAGLLMLSAGTGLRLGLRRRAS